MGPQECRKSLVCVFMMKLTDGFPGTRRGRRSSGVLQKSALRLAQAGTSALRHRGACHRIICGANIKILHCQLHLNLDHRNMTASYHASTGPRGTTAPVQPSSDWIPDWAFADDYDCSFSRILSHTKNVGHSAVCKSFGASQILSQ